MNYNFYYTSRLVSSAKDNIFPYMDYTIYKPNSKNTGGLVKFSTNKVKNNKKDTWEEVLFAEFVPQKTWNAEKRIGTFDHTAKKVVALSATEAGEFLFTFNSKIEFNAYHKNGNSGTGIKLVHFEGKRKCGYGDTEEWKAIPRFGFSVSEKGKIIKVPVEMGEVECLKVLLTSFIKEKAAIDGKESARKFKEYKKNQEDKPRTKQEEETEIEEEIPF